MRKTAKDFFKIKNPSKYMGDCTKIVYRSSWELTVMNFFDNHPNIIAWGSEIEKIPYLNPLKKKMTVYIPDFVIVIDDGKGNRHVEMIEIKPASQIAGAPKLTASGKPRRVSKYDLAEQIKNEAKWKAALIYCAKRGWRFQVMTEHTLFGHRKGA